MLFSASIVNVVIFLLCQQWFAAGPFIAQVEDTSKSILLRIESQRLGAWAALWDRAAAVAASFTGGLPRIQNAASPAAIFYRSRFDPIPVLPPRKRRHILKVAIMIPCQPETTYDWVILGGCWIMRTGTASSSVAAPLRSQPTPDASYPAPPKPDSGEPVEAF
jgi:hypothetical protein